MGISIKRSELHQITDDEAIALVDEKLGEASAWRSKIISYRLDAPFQSFWKAEVGHWLHTAKQFRYVDDLVAALHSRANAPKPQIPDERKVDDVLYELMLAELGPAMVAHYLLRTGSTFRKWDDPDNTGNDVDLAVTTAAGVDVDIQVKVPGYVDPIKAVTKGARQLKASPAHTLIAVCSKSLLYVSNEPRQFSGPLVGVTTMISKSLVELTSRGKFADPEFAHVGAVMLIDYLPLATEPVYSCTVLLNPWCQAEKSIDPEWLPRARFLTLPGDRDRFKWKNERPSQEHEFPDDTYVREDFR
jgi:hypothetical protein